MKIITCIKKLLIATSLLSTSVFVNAGNFDVDGCFSCGGENYDVGFEVNFSLEGGVNGTGYLYFGQGEGTTQYMYFKLAEDYVDTAYGVAASAAAGWGKKVHKFKDLIESDKFGNNNDGVQFFNGDGSTLLAEIQVDLLACDEGKTKCISKKKVYDENQIFSSSGNHVVVNGGSAVGGSKGEESEVTDGDASFISAIRTSMDWNVGVAGFDTMDSVTPLANQTNGGWQSYVGYEFEFNSNIFGNLDDLTTDNISNFLALGESHASPPKRELTDDPEIGDKCEPDDDKCFPPTTDIPEPTSLAIFVLGIVGLSLSRRQLRLT